MKQIPTLLLALLLVSACGGASKSQRSEAEFRCTLAQFQGDAGAATMCQDDCAAGYAEACATLGSMHQRGHLVEQSHAEAIRFSDRACELGDATGCFYAGSWRTSTDDQIVRVSSLEKACLDGKLTLRDDIKFACYESATAYLNGFGVTPDKQRGVGLAEKACRAGSFEACDGNFASPPVFADSGDVVLAPKTKQPDAKPTNDGMALTIGSMEADGLKVNDLSCQNVKNGLGAGLMIVGLLSKQKPALDACKATKDVTIGWTSTDGVMSHVSATSEEAAPAECVKNVIAAAALPHGVCTAVLPAQ